MISDSIFGKDDKKDKLILPESPQETVVNLIEKINNRYSKASPSSNIEGVDGVDSPENNHPLIILKTADVIQTCSGHKPLKSKPPEKVLVLGTLVKVEGVLSSLQEIADAAAEAIKAEQLERVVRVAEAYQNSLILRLRSFLQVAPQDSDIIAQVSSDIAFWKQTTDKLTSLQKQIEQEEKEKRELEAQTLEEQQKAFNDFLDSFKEHENPALSHVVQKLKVLLQAKKLPDNPYAQMQTNWAVVEILQKEKKEKSSEIVKEEVAQFCLNLLQKVENLEPAKMYVVLPQIYTLILGYLTDTGNELYEGFSSPALASKLMDILLKFKENNYILEPLHYTLNLLDLDVKQLEIVLDIMTKPGVKKPSDTNDPGIAVSLLGFYNRLKAVFPKSDFFKKQSQIEDKISKILDTAKQDGYYDELLAQLGGCKKPITEKEGLNLAAEPKDYEQIIRELNFLKKVILELNSLASQLVLPPEVLDLASIYSMIGMEVEGPYQPGQTNLNNALLNTPNAPQGFILGEESSGSCLEVRTLLDREYLNLTHYLKSLPDLLKYLQCIFSLKLDSHNPLLQFLRKLSLHIHYDKKTHPNVPHIFDGRYNKQSLGVTWESRGHGLTPFSSPEVLLTLICAMVKSKAPKEYSIESISALVLNQDIYPFLFELDPLFGLYFKQNNHNPYNNQFIFKYIDLGPIFDQLAKSERLGELFELFQTNKKVISQNPDKYVHLLKVLVQKGQAKEAMSLVQEERFQQGIMEKPSKFEYLLEGFIKKGCAGEVVLMIEKPQFKQAILNDPDKFQTLLMLLVENGLGKEVMSLVQNYEFEKAILNDPDKFEYLLITLVHNEQSKDIMDMLLKLEFKEAILQNADKFQNLLASVVDVEKGHLDAVMSIFLEPRFQRAIFQNLHNFRGLLACLAAKGQAGMVMGIVKKPHFKEVILNDPVKFPGLLGSLAANGHIGAVMSIFLEPRFQRAIFQDPGRFQYLLIALVENGNAELVLDMLETPEFKKAILQDFSYFQFLLLSLVKEGYHEKAWSIIWANKKVILQDLNGFGYFLSQLIENGQAESVINLFQQGSEELVLQDLTIFNEILCGLIEKGQAKSVVGIIQIPKIKQFISQNSDSFISLLSLLIDKGKSEWVMSIVEAFQQSVIEGNLVKLEYLLNELTDNEQAKGVMNMLLKPEVHQTVLKNFERFRMLLGKLIEKGNIEEVMSIVQINKETILLNDPWSTTYLLEKLVENGQDEAVMNIVQEPDFKHAILQNIYMFGPLLASLIENGQAEKVANIFKEPEFQQYIIPSRYLLEDLLDRLDEKEYEV